ncbi:MAG: 30S ribosomal protein S17 [Acidobacteriales bacterium]|nr:30S ribosomal protein S17 [Terriglobales bacterium]
MAENTQQQAQGSRRNEKIGHVVSNKMNKTIVVEVVMRKAHPKYGRIVRHSKKFYAHDEGNTCHVGDVVRIRETRPLSKLKRWELAEVLRKDVLSEIKVDLADPTLTGNSEVAAQ